MLHLPQQIRLQNRIVDLVRYEVRFDGKTLGLTRLEAKLLGYLAAHAERVIPKDELLSKVWGYHSMVRSRAISNTANRLRPKIEADPSSPRHLIVLYGRGLTLRGVELLDAPPPTQPPPRQAPPTKPKVGLLLGRKNDLTAIQRLLLEHRLVTVVGFGGIGKTRLAERIAADLDGHFVPLRTARSVADVTFEIARVLGVPLGEGDAVAGVDGLLRNLKDALLVLDNVEQLSEAALEAIAHWLPRAPGVRFLLTSRRVLGLPGEQVHRLRGLSTPDSVGELSTLQQNSAMQIFLRRAKAAGGFSLDEHNAEAVLEIIRQLDGVPLALELVASRTALLSPQQLLDRLPDLWSRESSARKRHHAGLHEVVRWSWELLRPEEQLSLAAASIFVGSFTLEAAEAVIEPFLDDTAPAVDVLLRRLMDCSLLMMIPGEPVRLSLYPPVHSFARQQRQHWSSEEQIKLEEHHGEYYGQLGDHEFLGGLTSAGLSRRREVLISALENVQVAVTRAMRRNDVPMMIRCAKGCAAARIEQGPQSALVELIPPILRMPGVTVDASVRLRVVLSAALRGLARPEEARVWLEEGLAMSPSPSAQAQMLMERGEVHSLAGRLNEAVEDHRTALKLFSASRDALGKARAQTLLSGVLQVQGEGDEALDLLEESLRVRRLRGDVRGQVVTLRCIAVTEWSLGNLREAHHHLQQASILARGLQDISRLTPTLMNLALLLGELDQREESRELLQEVIPLCERLGHPLHHAVTLINLAEVCIDLDDLDAAWGHLETGLSVADPEAWPRVTAFAHSLAADIWLKRQRPRRARRRINKARAICATLRDPFVIGRVEIVQGRVLAMLGETEAAAVALRDALDRFKGALEGVVLGRALVLLGHAWLEVGQPAQAQTHVEAAERLLASRPQESRRLERELQALKALL